jgi:hypothetical protein
MTCRPKTLLGLRRWTTTCNRVRLAELRRQNAALRSLLNRLADVRTVIQLRADYAALVHPSAFSLQPSALIRHA